MSDAPMLLPKPFSIRTLAERWDCSEEHVRRMVKSGRLRTFDLGGKLIRISAEEVERWETSQSSSGTGENSQSDSPRTDIDSAVRLARMTLPSVGQGLPSLNGSGRYSK